MQVTPHTPPATTPEPFWQRLRAITLYPFRGAALASLVALTLASLLGLVPVVGWIISVLVWIGAYKYAFEVLRATADGRMEAPEVVLGVDDGTVTRLILMQLVFIVTVGVAMVFGGPIIGLAVLAFIAFAQPGCVMSLAIDGSLSRALNPSTPLELVGRIGWPYLAVFGLLFVIQASALTASVWLVTWMPPVLADLTVTAVAFWGLFAAFHLMGYLVYQYHDVLGYQPSAQHGLPGLHSPDADLLTETEDHVRAGRLDSALELLRGETRSRAVSLDVHDLYHRLLRQNGDIAALSGHAGEYLNLLMLERQERRALGLLRAVLDVDPDFVPAQVEHARQLAERARLAGQGKLAADLLRALLRAHPRHVDAARWGLDAALLLVERMGSDDEARALLEQASGRCEDPALQEKIEAALKALEAPVPA